MKNSSRRLFYINRYNVLGGVLLLPFFLLLSIDAISRIIQGDLFHYNRSLYAFLSQTPLYWFPIFFTWIVIFPPLAVAINLIPLANQIGKKHTPLLSITFVKKNLGSFLLLGIGSFFIAFVPLHDFAPCMLNGILSKGIGEFIQLLQYCRNA